MPATKSSLLHVALESTHPYLVLGVGLFVALGVLVGVLWVVRLRKAKRWDPLGPDISQAERERIARELHDTLLQGTQALLFRLQMWEDHPDMPSSLREEIAAVVLHTKAIVVESRQRIYQMREIPEVDLRQAIAVIAQESATGHGAAFNLAVTGRERPLRVETRDQVLHIAREAVRNAYQHSRCSQVEVGLHYGCLSLRLTIADDGRGMAPSATTGPRASSHFGMLGMRERAAQLHGQFELDSQPGRGTRVVVRIPARIAFQKGFYWPWPWYHRSSGVAFAR